MAINQGKVNYLQMLVDKFDKEDVEQNKFKEAESSVTGVFGALDPDQLQVTRLVTTNEGEVKLSKFYVKA